MEMCFFLLNYFNLVMLNGQTHSCSACLQVKCSIGESKNAYCVAGSIVRKVLVIETMKIKLQNSEDGIGSYWLIWVLESNYGLDQCFSKSGLRSGSGPGGNSIRTRLYLVFQAH